MNNLRLVSLYLVLMACVFAGGVRGENFTATCASNSNFGTHDLYKKPSGCNAATLSNCESTAGFCVFLAADCTAFLSCITAYTQCMRNGVTASDVTSDSTCNAWATRAAPVFVATPTWELNTPAFQSCAAILCAGQLASYAAKCSTESFNPINNGKICRPWFTVTTTIAAPTTTSTVQIATTTEAAAPTTTPLTTTSRPPSTTTTTTSAATSTTVRSTTTRPPSATTTVTASTAPVQSMSPAPSTTTTTTITTTTSSASIADDTTTTLSGGGSASEESTTTTTTTTATAGFVTQEDTTTLAPDPPPPLETTSEFTTTTPDTTSDATTIATETTLPLEKLPLLQIVGVHRGTLPQQQVASTLTLAKRSIALLPNYVLPLVPVSAGVSIFNYPPARACHGTFRFAPTVASPTRADRERVSLLNSNPTLSTWLAAGKFFTTNETALAVALDDMTEAVVKELFGGKALQPRIAVEWQPSLVVIDVQPNISCFNPARYLPTAVPPALGLVLLAPNRQLARGAAHAEQMLLGARVTAITAGSALFSGTVAAQAGRAGFFLALLHCSPPGEAAIPSGIVNPFGWTMGDSKEVAPFTGAAFGNLVLLVAIAAALFLLGVALAFWKKTSIFPEGIGLARWPGALQFPFIIWLAPTTAYSVVSVSNGDMTQIAGGGIVLLLLVLAMCAIGFRLRTMYLRFTPRRIDYEPSAAELRAKEQQREQHLARRETPEQTKQRKLNTLRRIMFQVKLVLRGRDAVNAERVAELELIRQQFCAQCKKMKISVSEVVDTKLEPHVVVPASASRSDSGSASPPPMQRAAAVVFGVSFDRALGVRGLMTGTASIDSTGDAEKMKKREEGSEQSCTSSSTVFEWLFGTTHHWVDYGHAARFVKKRQAFQRKKAERDAQQRAGAVAGSGAKNNNDKDKRDDNDNDNLDGDENEQNNEDGELQVRSDDESASEDEDAKFYAPKDPLRSGVAASGWSAGSNNTNKSTSKSSSSNKKGSGKMLNVGDFASLEQGLLNGEENSGGGGGDRRADYDHGFQNEEDDERAAAEAEEMLLVGGGAATASSTTTSPQRRRASQNNSNPNNNGDDDDNGGDRDGDVTAVDVPAEAEGATSSSSTAAVAAGPGFKFPADARRFNRRYGLLAREYGDRCSWFYLVEVIFTFLVGILQGLTSSAASCLAGAAVFLVILLVYLGLIVHKRPMQLGIDYLFVACVSVCQLAVGIFYLLGTVENDSSAIEFALQLTSIACYLIVLRALLHLLYYVVYHVLIRKVLPKMRKRAAEREAAAERQAKEEAERKRANAEERLLTLQAEQRERFEQKLVEPRLQQARDAEQKEFDAIVDRFLQSMPVVKSKEEDEEEEEEQQRRLAEAEAEAEAAAVDEDIEIADDGAGQVNAAAAFATEADDDIVLPDDDNGAPLETATDKSRGIINIDDEGEQAAVEEDEEEWYYEEGAPGAVKPAPDAEAPPLLALPPSATTSPALGASSAPNHNKSNSNKSTSSKTDKNKIHQKAGHLTQADVDALFEDDEDDEDAQQQQQQDARDNDSSSSEIGGKRYKTRPANEHRFTRSTKVYDEGDDDDFAALAKAAAAASKRSRRRGQEQPQEQRVGDDECDDEIDDDALVMRKKKRSNVDDILPHLSSARNNNSNNNNNSKMCANKPAVPQQQQHQQQDDEELLLDIDDEDVLDDDQIDAVVRRLDDEEERNWGDDAQTEADNFSTVLPRRPDVTQKMHPKNPSSAAPVISRGMTSKDLLELPPERQHNNSNGNKLSVTAVGDDAVPSLLSNDALLALELESVGRSRMPGYGSQAMSTPPKSLGRKFPALASAEVKRQPVFADFDDDLPEHLLHDGARERPPVATVAYSSPHARDRHNRQQAGVAPPVVIRGGNFAAERDAAINRINSNNNNNNNRVPGAQNVDRSGDDAAAAAAAAILARQRTEELRRTEEQLTYNQQRLKRQQEASDRVAAAKRNALLSLPSHSAQPRVSPARIVDDDHYRAGEDEECDPNIYDRASQEPSPSPPRNNNSNNNNNSGDRHAAAAAAQQAERDARHVILHDDEDVEPWFAGGGAASSSSASPADRRRAHLPHQQPQSSRFISKQPPRRPPPPPARADYDDDDDDGVDSDFEELLAKQRHQPPPAHNHHHARQQPQQQRRSETRGDARPASLSARNNNDPRFLTLAELAALGVMPQDEPPAQEHSGYNRGAGRTAMPSAVNNNLNQPRVFPQQIPAAPAVAQPRHEVAPLPGQRGSNIAAASLPFLAAPPHQSPAWAQHAAGSHTGGAPHRHQQQLDRDAAERLRGADNFFTSMRADAANNNSNRGGGDSIQQMLDFANQAELAQANRGLSSGAAALRAPRLLSTVDAVNNNNNNSPMSTRHALNEDSQHVLNSILRAPNKTEAEHAIRR